MPFELLGIEIAIEGGAAAAIAGSLAPLPSPPSGPPRTPGVVITAEQAEDPLPLPVGPAVFVHPPVRAVRDGDALVVGDGASRLTVHAGGTRIDAELAPEALDGAGAALVRSLHLPVALAFALRHHHVYHLHAAVLADGDDALLVVGQAEVGKTTLAIALLEAGLGALCDDAAFVADTAAGIRVQGIPRPFHLRPATLRAFPRLAACAGPADEQGRRDLDPGAAWGPPRRGRLHPGALLFPELTGRPVTSVEPLGPADALGRLIEASALLVVDGAAHPPEHLALLGRLASEARALRVSLGEDLLRAPVEVARAILAAR